MYTNCWSLSTLAAFAALMTYLCKTRYKRDPSKKDVTHSLSIFVKFS